MEENFASLIFGLTDHSVPETSYHIPNYEDHNSDSSSFHSFDNPAYTYCSPDTAPTHFGDEAPYISDKLRTNSPRHSPNFISESENDPFSIRSRIPIPGFLPMSRYHMWLETSFMCRRNERERQRVRNVNDGFSRLRNHLPRSANVRRRQSKVETLQHAIKYIKYLQNLLGEEKEDE